MTRSKKGEVILNSFQDPPNLRPTRPNRARARARAAGLATVTAAAALALATAPPNLPSPEQARAAWTPSDAILLARDGTELARIRTDPAARRGDWLPLARISPALITTLVAAEDHRFATHGGVDLAAAAAALQARITGHGRPRGASTITMQLAALLAPQLRTPGRRGPLTKLTQARAAWALERNWTKPQILEAYLNLAPTRGELIGADATARALFGHSAAGLTAAEAAAYAALLPAPRAAPAVLARRACAAARATATPCAAATAALDTALLGVPPGRDPGLAPQLAVRLLQPGARTLRTTLDPRIQALAAGALARRLAALGPSNARDGAAIVADVTTGEILAYVGSAGPLSRAPHVDGAAAPRQAGSTLKPFLYALALDQRRLTAASVLDDSPVHLQTASGLYVPQDYDRQFRGPVTVRSALGNSLNVPAVRALLLTGVESFRDTLLRAGYAHIVEEGEYYGFSLALGSAEVTLVEQAAAYRALARGGLAAPLRLTPGPAPTQTRALSPQAAAIVASILADPAARESTFGAGNVLALPFWAAVKTGTSKAMRDNWCVGFTSRYVVAVWVGNFEGDSMAGVSGTTGAAPAWREIMLALHPSAPPAPPPTRGLARARVTFAPAIEPARDELFLPGTVLHRVALAPALARPPRITAPADGTVLALDPDIPRGHQRIPVRLEGSGPGIRLALDGRPLTAAVWTPTPGDHRLTLTDATGQILDRVRVQVR